MTRTVWLLIAASFVSDMGDWFFRLAVPLLVYETTTSPLLTAAVYALEYVPCIVVSPIGGLLADKLDRRWLISVTNAVAALLALALAYCSTGSSMSVVFLFVVLLGAAEPMIHPAIQAMLPTLVRPRGLPRVNAVMQALGTAVVVVGPVLAGGVIVTLGARNALIVDALSFGFAGALVMGVKAVSKSNRDSRSAAGGGGLRDGIRAISRNPVLKAGTALFMTTNAVTAAVQASLFFWFVGVQHEAVTSMTYILAAQGLGAMAGASISAHVLARVDPGKVMVLGTQFAGVCVMLLVVVDMRPFMLMLWAAEAAAGTAIAVAWFTLRQRVVSNDLLGRTVALTRTLAFASIPVGSIVGGWLLGTTQSLGSLLLLSGLVQLLAGVFMLASVLFRGDGMNVFRGRHRDQGRLRHSEAAP